MRASVLAALLGSCHVFGQLDSSSFDLAQLTVESIEKPDEVATTHYIYLYDGQPISPWHDIPYAASTDADGARLLHFVCEIPLGSRAKFEIHKSKPLNPVVQDVKNGKPRFYSYGPSIVNYGAISQTWEDPEFISKDTGFGGDNDPIDVLQINSAPCSHGEVMPVRVLGALALVDDDETDWKIIVADARDPATQSYRDIHDLPEEKVSEMREWFRLYKTAEGKGPNKFGLEERAMDASFALAVADETHEIWQTMESKKCTFDGIPCWTRRTGRRGSSKNEF